MRLDHFTRTHFTKTLSYATIAMGVTWGAAACGGSGDTESIESGLDSSTTEPAEVAADGSAAVDVSSPVVVPADTGQPDVSIEEVSIDTDSSNQSTGSEGTGSESTGSEGTGADDGGSDDAGSDDPETGSGPDFGKLPGNGGKPGFGLDGDDDDADTDDAGSGPDFGKLPGNGGKPGFGLGGDEDDADEEFDSEDLADSFARFEAEQCHQEFGGMMISMALAGLITGDELNDYMLEAKAIMDRLDTDEDPEDVAADMCGLLEDHRPDEGI